MQVEEYVEEESPYSVSDYYIGEDLGQADIAAFNDVSVPIQQLPPVPVEEGLFTTKNILIGIGIIIALYFIFGRKK